MGPDSWAKVVLFSGGSMTPLKFDNKFVIVVDIPMKSFVTLF
jgi:hypothetical protein